MLQILDGNGKGNLAEVNESRRLLVNSLQRGISDDASLEGKSFNINTGIINLTSANKSAVIYVKNIGNAKIVVENLFYLIGNSTGGSGDTLITVLKNPTTGTIIDTATDCEMAGVNRNFGSTRPLEANMYKGSEAATFTNGVKVIESIFNQVATRAAINVGTIILNKNDSIGIDYTPGAGNTSLDVEFAMAIHIED